MCILYNAENYSFDVTVKVGQARRSQKCLEGVCIGQGCVILSPT